MASMFKKWKTRRQIAEVSRLTDPHIAVFNEALARWQGVLQIKADLYLDSLDERLVGLVESETLKFDQLAEIELTAMLKNWIEAQDTSVADLRSCIPDDTIEVLSVMGAESRIDELALEHHERVGREIADRAVQAINEEATRRGTIGLEE